MKLAKIIRKHKCLSEFLSQNKECLEIDKEYLKNLQNIEPHYKDEYLESLIALAKDKIAERDAIGKKYKLEISDLVSCMSRMGYGEYLPNQNNGSVSV